MCLVSIEVDETMTQSYQVRCTYFMWLSYLNQGIIALCCACCTRTPLQLTDLLATCITSAQPSPSLTTLEVSLWHDSLVNKLSP
jgi:hypothetical protein